MKNRDDEVTQKSKNVSANTDFENIKLENIEMKNDSKDNEENLYNNNINCNEEKLENDSVDTNLQDEIIKKAFEGDNIMSEKANQTFKNLAKQIHEMKAAEMDSTEIKKTGKIKINEMKGSTINNKVDQNGNSNLKDGKNVEKKRHKVFGKIITLGAALTTIAASATIALYTNGYHFNFNKNTTTQEEVQSISNGQEILSSKTVSVANEVIDESKENKIKDESKNDYLDAILYEDNTVGLMLTDKAIDYLGLNCDKEAVYKVTGATNKYTKILACTMGAEGSVYVLLLTDNQTVEFIEMYTEELFEIREEGLDKTIEFYDGGTIAGLTKIVDFEQETSKNDDGSYWYCVYAVRANGVKKDIRVGSYNDMESLSTSTKTFTSQDGEESYEVSGYEGEYYTASGFAGASNHVYYVKDNCLYHLNLADGSTTKDMTGVAKLWQQSDGQIVARRSTVSSVIHVYDPYVLYEDYCVNDAEVIDTKENDAMIMQLKSDGTVTLMFKNGGRKLISGNATETSCVLYRGALVNVKATAIWMGTLGTKTENCIAYATTDNHVVMVDMKSYVENRTYSGSFYFSSPEVITNGTFTKKIVSMESATVPYTNVNGQEIDVKNIAVIFEDGTKDYTVISPVMIREQK